MKNTEEKFNLVIAGVGGQGLITLLQLIAEAALDQGFDLKTSELHGLSQRGGSVEVHIRFGRKIYSPLVPRGKADLVLALEAQESLRGASFAGPRTVFLVNEQITPIPLTKSLSLEQISNDLEKVSKKVIFSGAAAICQKELGTAVVAGVYLLGLAVRKKIIPLNEASIIRAIKKVIPKQYLTLNLKAFKLAKD